MQFIYMYLWPGAGDPFMRLLEITCFTRMETFHAATYTDNMWVAMHLSEINAMYYMLLNV